MMAVLEQPEQWGREESKGQLDVASFFLSSQDHDLTSVVLTSMSLSFPLDFFHSATTVSNL